MDDRRCSGRLKSVNLTKLQESYKRYSRVVPRKSRRPELAESWHPNTPDYRLSVSHSQWSRRLSNWRRLIHRWERIPDSGCDLLASRLKDCDLKGFVELCEESSPETVTRDVCRDLLAPDSRESFYPVIFKPAWFKGDINSSGFQTVGETEFIAKSREFLSDLDPCFTREFVSKYTRNY